MTTRQAVEGLWRGQRRAFLAIFLGFLTRALIPAGFMPGASGLEFCSGGMRASVPAMAGHAHDHYHDGAGAPSGPTSHGDGCVFAGSAAGLAPLSAPVVVAALPNATPSFEIPASAVTSNSPTPRAQSPRGPPALS
jgi:hypothetical protein